MGKLLGKSLITLMGVTGLLLLRILRTEHSSLLPLLGRSWLKLSSIRHNRTTRSTGMWSMQWGTRCCYLRGICSCLVLESCHSVGLDLFLSLAGLGHVPIG